jgi:O-antigen/teichoic acid export membrane protein
VSVPKKIAINTFSQILAKITIITFGVLGTLFLRRFLGRSLYGDFVFIVSLATMFATLADFGSHLIGVREANQDQKNQARILGNIILLRFLLAVISSLALILFNFLLRLSHPALIFASLTILAISFKNSLTLVFHSQQKLTTFSWMNFLDGLFTFLGTLLLIFILKTKMVPVFVFNLSLATFLSAIFFLPRALQKKTLNFKPSKTILKKFLLQTAPMGGILLLFTLYSKIDTVLLKNFQNSSAVGIYGLTYKIHENLNVLAAYLMNSLLPIMAQLGRQKKDRPRFKKIFQTGLDILILSGGTLITGVFLFAPLIIRLLTGEYLTEEVLSLRILIFATFISFLNHLVGYSIIALRQQHKSFFIAVLALVFNLVLNLIFIPLYSFKAAAVITVLTEALVLFLSFKIIIQKLNWRPKFLQFWQTGLQILKTRGKIFFHD